MKTTAAFIVSLLVSVTVIGCSQQGEQAAQTGAQPQQQAASAPAPSAPAHPEPAAHPAHPAMPAHPAGQPAAATYQGKVLKATHAGGYTYIEVEREGGSLWLACSPVNVQTGQTIAWGEGAVMHNFASKSLHRTFDEIVFVSTVTIVE